TMKQRRCSYLVVVDRASGDMRELAAYLSEIAVANFEVIILDRSGCADNRRVLRWVGRYVVSDTMQTAIGLTSCEKVIVADSSVRYSRDTLNVMSALLELHDVVEPRDYYDPLPWWIDPFPDRGSTYGFRKRPTTLRGAEVLSAMSIFVRKLPPALSDWLRDLPRRAGQDSALFFLLLPAILALSVFGSGLIAAGFAG